MPWRQNRFCNCTFLALHNWAIIFYKPPSSPPIPGQNEPESGWRAEILTGSNLVRWSLPSELCCLLSGYSQFVQSCDQTFCLWLATGKLSTIYTLQLRGGGGRDHLGAHNTAVWSAKVRRISLWLCLFFPPLMHLAPDDSMGSELSTLLNWSVAISYLPPIVREF